MIGRLYDYLMYVVAVAALVGGSWLLVRPASFPLFESPLAPYLGQNLEGMAALLVIGSVFVVGLFLRKARGTAIVARPSLSARDPEEITTDATTPATSQMERFYPAYLQYLDSPQTPDRRAAMYGRRTFAYTDTTSDAEYILEELAITVRDTYAVTAGSDRERAARAVQTGSWTDNRTVAAFLATDAEAAPAFTIVERLWAFAFPKRTFTNRVAATVRELDQLAATYLTHEPMADRPAEPGPVSGRMATNRQRAREILWAVTEDSGTEPQSEDGETA